MKQKKYLLYILTFFMIINLILPTCFSFASSKEPVVNAPVALLMDSETGKILYEKNANNRVYPASTTKIMTAILALENRTLTDKATVSSNAVSSVPSGYSHANLQVDEILTMEQLLYALLLPSANDAAIVIAEDIAGSTENFANMMNEKAKELGCKDTNFVNPNGVHDENHYSTAYDLALMGQYAMKNETFRKMVSTVRYTLPVTNKYDKEDRIFVTTNRLVNSKSGQYYEYATGIKTGYTDPAKNCVVASAKKNDMELICVIMGAEGDLNTDINKFGDCISLFDYGFEEYKYETLCHAGDVFNVITPKNASKDTNSLSVLFENDINALMKQEDTIENIPFDVNYNKNLKAPITQGDVIGNITYNIDGINYTTNLVAGQDILADSIFNTIFKILILIAVLYFLKLVFRKKKKKKRYKKTKKKGKRYASGRYD